MIAPAGDLDEADVTLQHDHLGHLVDRRQAEARGLVAGAVVGLDDGEELEGHGTAISRPR